MKKRSIFIIEIILMILITYFYYSDRFNLILVSYIFMMIFWIVRRFTKNGIFDINLIFLTVLSMYNLVIPINYICDNLNVEDFYFLAYDYSIVKKHLFILSIFSFVFILGGEFDLNNKYDLDKQKYHNNSYFHFNKSVEIVISIIEYIGILFFYCGIYKLGGISYLKSPYIWNSDKKLEIGIMTSGFQLACSMIIIKFYLYLIKKKKNNQKLNLMCFKETYIMIILIITKIYQGNRLQLIYLLLSLLSLYNFIYRNINLKKFIFIITIISLFLGFAGYFRYIKDLESIKISDMILYGLGQSQKLEFFLNSYTNLTTMYILDNFNVESINGLSFLDIFTYLLPRFIVPSKDKYIFTQNWIIHNSYYMNISPVGGLNFLAQLLMNFRYLFGALVMFLIGFFFNNIYNKYIKNNFSYSNILFYSLLVPYVISLVRNPMFITGKEIVQFVLLPFIVYKLFNKKN